jgi:hypothetical protein
MINRESDEAATSRLSLDRDQAVREMLRRPEEDLPTLRAVKWALVGFVLGWIGRALW